MFGGQARVSSRASTSRPCRADRRRRLVRLRADAVRRGRRRPAQRQGLRPHHTCEYVVLATHTPLMGKTNLASATLLQTKLYLYTSYVVGGRVAKGAVPDVLFWDTASPYHYLRLSRQRGSRLRHLRRQRSQDRPGRRHRALLRAARGGRPARRAVARRHASLVGPGHRDERRAAVHRRDIVPSVRRDGLRGQRDDVRDARRDDGARRVHGPEESVAGAVRPRAHEGARRSVGLSQGERRLSLLHDSRPHRRAAGHLAAGAAGRRRQGARRSMASALPRLAAPTAASPWSRRCARTWAAWSNGIVRRGPGTARATAHGSCPTARSSPDRPRRRWSRMHRPAVRRQRQG